MLNGSAPRSGGLKGAWARRLTAFFASLVMALPMTLAPYAQAAAYAETLNGDSVIAQEKADESQSEGPAQADAPAQEGQGSEQAGDVADAKGEDAGDQTAAEPDAAAQPAAGGQADDPAAQDAASPDAAPADEPAAAADGLQPGSTISADATISQGGNYFLADAAKANITLATADPVTIIGKGFSWNGTTFIGTPANIHIDASSVDAGVNITFRDVYTSGKQARSVIDFPKNATSTFKVVSKNIIDYDVSGGANPATLRVTPGATLNILGSGTLYLYKHAMGAAIGGSSGELGGTVNFGDKATLTGPTVFAKSSKQGSLVGAGSNSSKSTDTPGTINFYGGLYNLICNSMSAAVGGAAGDVTGGTPGSTVNVYSGASVNINVDFNGAAIGGGAGVKGGENETDGGTLHVFGGSIRTYIDKNASTYWKDDAGNTIEGVSSAAITAQKLDGGSNPVYLLPFDTSQLKKAATSFKVSVDGTAFYNGGSHVYSYVNEALEKADQKPISATPTNWGPMAKPDTNLYLYLTAGKHRITVNGEEFAATWDDASKTFKVSKAPDKPVSTWYDASKKDLTIKTPEELAQFAAILNGTDENIAQDDFHGKTVTLAADLDLKGFEDWTPAGDADHAFAGTFDGAGHSVTNLSITDATGGYHGLFGNNAGAIKNVKVSGRIGTAEAPITMANGADNIGGLVGFNDGTVSGITGNVAITVNTSEGPGGHGGIYAVGGIVGQNDVNGVVETSSNTARIEGSKAVGGIAGRSYHVIRNSFNTGEIKGNGGSKDGLGGIVGISGDKNKTYQTSVTGCYNTGKLSNQDPNGNLGRWYGGIVGMVDGAASVDYNFNVGELAEGYSWNWNPIIGHVDATVNDDDESTADIVSAKGNYTLDTVKFGDKDTSTGTQFATIGTRVSADELKGADVLKALNAGGDYFKADSTVEPVNDGYPVLVWQEVKEAPKSWYDPAAQSLTITTPEELAQFAAILNGTDKTFEQDDFHGKTVTLAADLDLKGFEDWTPAGDADHAFAGTFDGAGHTVANLTITDAAGGYHGLFGNNAGTIKDLAVSGAIGSTEKPINAETGADNIGGLVGFNAGTVSGITGDVAVTVNVSTGSPSHGGSIYAVGGVVGQNGEHGVVEKSSNAARVEGTKSVGGVVGRSYGTVRESFNTGAVVGNGGGKDGVGGVLGMAGDKSSTYKTVTLANYNTGTVSNKGGRWHGGIVGMADSSAVVKNNYDTGVIEEGYSWNWNPIIGHVDSAYAGVENNYSLEGLKAGDTNVDTKSQTVGIVTSEADFKASGMPTNLNLDGRYFAIDSGNINGGFPVLAWQVNSAPKLLGVVTDGQPKVSYTEGDALDISGLKLFAQYSDGSAAIVSSYKVTVGDAEIDPAKYTLSKTDDGKQLTVSGSFEGMAFTYSYKLAVEGKTPLAVTVEQPAHGKVSATPTDGAAGTKVTLTLDATEGYELDHFTVDGEAIEGDSFTLDKNVTVSAVLKPIVYKISYNIAYGNGSNDPANPATYTVESDDIELKPAIVTEAAAKQGYIFDAWHLDSDKGAVVTSIPKGSTGDVRLYGTFVRARSATLYISTLQLTGRDWKGDDAFTFGFEPADDATKEAVAAGELIMPANDEVTVQAPANPTTDPVDIKLGPITPRKNGAKYRFKVYQKVPATPEVGMAYDEHVFEFTGEVQNTFNTLRFKNLTGVSGTAAFKNTYTVPAPKTYTVSYIDVDGKEQALEVKAGATLTVDGKSQTIDGDLTLPALDEKPGYAKHGYKAEIDDDGNVTLTAYYGEAIRYSITYALDGGENSAENPSTYTVEDEVELAAPTKDGYTFNGWTDASGNAVTKIAKGTTGDLTLTATWIKNAPVMYTVSYQAEDGTQRSVEVEAGSYITVNGEKSQVKVNVSLESQGKIGYTGGYKVAQGADGSYEFTWTWTPISYKVTYNLDGGVNNADNPSTYTIEDEVELKEPTKDGYTFNGWENAAGSIVKRIVKGTTGDLTFTATWTKNAVESYTVAFKGVTGAQTVKIEKGKTLTVDGKAQTVTADVTVPDPTAKPDKGYGDVAYALIDEGDGNYALTTTSINAIDYKITYNLDGGVNNASNPATYTVEDEVKLAAPTKDGYTFQGWKDKSGKVVTKIAKGTAGDITLAATWKKNAETVKPGTDQNQGNGTNQNQTGSGNKNAGSKKAMPQTGDYQATAIAAVALAGAAAAGVGVALDRRKRADR